MAHSQPKVMTEEEARSIAAPILARRFKTYGYKTVSVTEEEDFDGEYILRMIVDVQNQVPTDELVDTVSDIRTALLKNGDDRFVFLRARLPNEDQIEQEVEP